MGLFYPNEEYGFLTGSVNVVREYHFGDGSRNSPMSSHTRKKWDPMSDSTCRWLFTELSQTTHSDAGISDWRSVSTMVGYTKPCYELTVTTNLPPGGPIS